MELRPADGVTFKALADNIAQDLKSNVELLDDGKRHHVLLENGSAIEIHSLTTGTFSIFPATPGSRGGWYTGDRLGAVLHKSDLELLNAQAIRVIRVVAMRAWKAIK